MKENFLYRVFRIRERESSIGSELYSGLILFLSSFFLIKFCADILRDSFVSGELNLVYPAMIIIIGATSGILTILSGFLTNLPFVVVPNIIFSLMIAITGHIYLGYSLEYVLVSAFIAAVIFTTISFFFKENRQVNLIPKSLKNSFLLILGLVLIVLGLINSGLLLKTVVPEPATTLGGVAPSITFTFPTSLGNIISPLSLLTIIGICLFGYLHLSKNRYSFIITFLVILILGFFFPADWSRGFSQGRISAFRILSPIGNVPRMDGFRIILSKITAPKTILNFFTFKQYWTISKSSSSLIILSFTFLITLFFINLFTISSLVDYGKEEENIDTNKKSFPKLSRINGFSALIGVLTNTTYYTYSAESAVSLINKGRTGLTAVFSGLLILLFTFLSSASGFLITPAATSVMLIAAGALILLNSIKKISFQGIDEFLPALIMILATIISMNPAEGLLLGFGAYTIIGIFKLMSGKKSELNWFMYLSLVIMILYYALRL